MEDKRILKTKRKLKEALITLLDSYSFEQITVKEICDLSKISRVTYYTHYSDKYQLVDDILNDLKKQGRELFYKMKKTDKERYNALDNPIESYNIILDIIIELFYSNYSFFKHTVLNGNPYLTSCFYSIIDEVVQNYTDQCTAVIELKYSSKKVTRLCCFGFAAFISECWKENENLEKVKEEAHSLLNDLLNSDVLLKH